MAVIRLCALLSVVCTIEGLIYEGTSFVVPLPSHDGNETGQLCILNKYPPTTCTITTENRTDIVNLTGNGQISVDLTRRETVQGSFLVHERGILLDCKRKVTAYVFYNSADLVLASATPLIPIDSLSTEYSVPLVSQLGSFVTVVAVLDGTSVTVKLGSTSADIRGKHYDDGEEIHFILDKLEVLQFTTETNLNKTFEGSLHFSETLVISNRRVAIFCGYRSVVSTVSRRIQTLHQIIPHTALGTMFVLPPIGKLKRHTAFVVSHINGTHMTDACCNGHHDTFSGESLFTTLPSAGLGSFLQKDETVAFFISAPVTVIRLVMAANVTQMYTTMVPPISQYGYDYWIPNIQPKTMSVERSITILTDPKCAHIFGFHSSWRNISFGSWNFSVTSLPVTNNLPRITTNPDCPFAVEVSFVGNSSAYGFFAVPNLEDPVDQDLKSSFNISCGVNHWYITLDTAKFQSSFQMSNTSNIYLSHAFCSGVRDGSVITFNYSYTDCSTQQQENGTDHVFSNYLVEYEVDGDTGIADRVLWRYGIQCIRPRHEVDFITFSPVDNTSDISIHSSSKVKGHQATIQFFTDSSFTNRMTGNPLKVIVGSPVYVQVQTTVTDGVKLLVDNCYASPDNRRDNSTVSLIEDRCESNRFVHILGAVDKVTRFYFYVFEIPHREDNIYITCDVSFCDLMDFSKECQHGCQKTNPRT